MARRNSAIELNRQVRGLITEAGPLTFPEDASVDERNFVLNRDGSRQRRLGMDLEEGFQTIPVESYEGYREVAYSSHRWGNLGERLTVQLVVVQSGRKLCFFDLAGTPVSGSKIFEYEIAMARPDKKMSFAVVDDQLVVASGSKDIHVFTYKKGSVEVETGRIKIRDLFGVHDLFPASGPNQIDLRAGNNISYRPEIELSDAHLYNLRNQTWGTIARIEDDENLDDPIFWFNLETSFTKFPSNADNLLSAYAPLTDDSDDRIGDRFHPKASVKESPGSLPAPRGYFIIDALERGKSRVEELQAWRTRQNGTGTQGTNPVRYDVTSLPQDSSAGGASVAATYSGRVFYSGFEGVITGGDKRSPKMEGMVIFSQLARDPDNLFKCYQEGDPTSKTNPDLLDTDGGFISIQGARDIKHLEEFDRYLLVFADNGVWAISGGSDFGFAATNYQVEKVTSFGCAGGDTVVSAGDSLFYWSHDGIYVIGGDETGSSLVSQSISEQTIQSLFEQTNNTQRELCKGEYETAKSRVRWLLYDRNENLDITRFYEVIYDTLLQAFYINEADTSFSGSPPDQEASGNNWEPSSLDRDSVYQFDDVFVEYEGGRFDAFWHDDGRKFLVFIRIRLSDPFPGVNVFFIRQHTASFPYSLQSLGPAVEHQFSLSIADTEEINNVKFDLSPDGTVLSIQDRGAVAGIIQLVFEEPYDFSGNFSMGRTNLSLVPGEDFVGIEFFNNGYSCVLVKRDPIGQIWVEFTEYSLNSPYLFAEGFSEGPSYRKNISSFAAPRAFRTGDEGTKVFLLNKNNLWMIPLDGPFDFNSFDFDNHDIIPNTFGMDGLDRAFSFSSGGDKVVLTEDDFNVSGGYSAYQYNVGPSLASGFSGSIDLFEGPGKEIVVTDSNVTVQGVDVTVNSEVVIVGTVTDRSIQRLMYYVTTLQTESGNSYTFSQYRDPTFYDWSSLVVGGVDTPAYLVSGYFPGEDFQREKSISYVTFHFLKTDDEKALDGTLIPKSSALVRTAWNWENDNNAQLGVAPFFGNSWSKQYQAYRYRRTGNVNSHDWGQGQTVISSKSKVRGSGKVFSFHIESEPGMDCKLQGWSLIISGAGNV